MSYANSPLIMSLHGENGGTSFPNYSSNSLSPVVHGAPVTSTAQSVYYGSSTYFDGSDDAFAYLHDGELDLSTGDFTVEFWVRFASLTGTQYPLIQRDGINTPGIAIITSGNNFRYLLGRGNGLYTYDITGTTTISINTWYHVRFTRNGSTGAGWVNGNADDSATSALTGWSGTEQINIARSGVGGTYHEMYLQDLRIIKGTALNSTSFTPPGKLIGTLSNQGTGGEAVKDDTGSAAARTIVAVPRSYSAGPSRDFRTVSNGSGLFSLTVPSADEFSDIGSYAVLALDDAAGTVYNDLVFGRVETV